MKIALINENSQKKKNPYILEILKNVARKYGHTVYNYGVGEDKDASIDYVGAGLLTSILLSTGAVDFVITGCASGQGVLITSNSLPNVTCGFVGDNIDAMLFKKINAGNAVSIPFGKMFGIGYETRLENIFNTLFKTLEASGYPEERKEIQDNQRQSLICLQNLCKQSLMDILDLMDKDLLYSVIANDYFEEHFFANSEDDEINEYLMGLIDYGSEI